MKKMKINFETMKFSRTRISELIEPLSVKQFNKIPEGLNTNIIWNIGHILASQQLFMYKKTNLPFTIDSEIITKYKSGSKVPTNVSEEEINQIKGLLFSTLEQVERDYYDSTFMQFESFTTKRGVPIETIEDAVSFHTFHEGVHLGWLWTISKLM